VRLTSYVANERERRLMLTAGRVAKVDLRHVCVVCDHASEKIGRDAAHKPGRRTQPRHPDSDVEARPSGDRYGRVAPVNGFDRQEINQGISATQQHGANFSSQLP
jgi:hypothetical protein